MDLNKVLDFTIEVLAKFLLGTIALYVLLWYVDVTVAFENTLVEMQLCDENTAKGLLIILCGLPNYIVFRRTT